MNKRKGNIVAIALLTLVISISGCITAFAGETTPTAGGKLTSTIYWSISGDVLTISGKGAMPAEGYTFPWADYSFSRAEIKDGITSIGSYAFSYCSSLKSVTIPESVTSIGEYAFESCIKLTSIDIPKSVTSIGNGAFMACSSLKSVTIPESVTSIGYGAFIYCSSLESITIPKSVTSIETNTFGYCSSLTSIKIPESVTSIDNSAFFQCTSLKTVEYACNGKYSVESQRPSLGLDGLVWSAKHYDLTHHDEVPATWTEAGLIQHWECSKCGKYFADEDGKKQLSKDELANRIVAHGDCGRDGDPVHWALDMDRKLTISGSGKMKNYEVSNSPWNRYKDYIKFIEIKDGITSIGTAMSLS